MNVAGIPVDPSAASSRAVNASDRANRARLGALVGCDPLLERRRAVRLPLDQWAAALLDRLREARSADGPQAWRAVAECMNNAALIEVFRGRLASAEKLCHLQLCWIAELDRRGAPDDVVALAFQPWINLGRLLRMQGEHAASLAHLAPLRIAEDARPVSLGPVRVDARRWSCWARDTGLRGVLLLAYVLDSMKALLAAERHEDALALIRAERGVLDGALLLPCTEAEIIVLAQQGERRAALLRAADPAWRPDAYHRLVGWTYQLLLGASARADAELRSSLVGVVHRLCAAPPAPGTDPKLCRLFLRLHAAAREIGEDGSALALARAGRAMSRTIGDSPHELAFIDAQLALCEGAERAELVAARDDLLERSLYLMLLRPRGLEPDARRAADPVFARLSEALASKCPAA